MLQKMITSRVKGLFLLLLVTLSFISLAGLALPQASAQEEPPSPEEEWYPYVPEEAKPLLGDLSLSVAPGGATTALTARLLDLNLNVRREFYVGDGMIFEFSTNFPRFLIWIYEWYPPGHVPRGHWLLQAVGPFSGGGTYRLGVFLPEPTEPEGLHVWKCWLLDLTSWRWATAIIRFNFKEHPQPAIVSVDILPEMKMNKPYSMTVAIRNTGEKQYAYTISVSGTGFTSNPPSTTSIIGAGETASLTFQVTPTISGKLSLTIEVKADSRVYDSRTFTVDVKSLKPSHTLSLQGVPEAVKLGEVVSLSALFTNTGEGVAKQVTLKLSSAEGVKPIKSFDSTSEVSAGGSYVFNLAVKPESGGFKTLIFVLEYLDEEGNRYSDSIMVSFDVLIPLKIGTVTKDKYQPLNIQFNVEGKQHSGLYETWMSSKPIQIIAPTEWEISNGVVAEFVRWSDGTTAPSRTIQVTAPMELMAEYRMKYRLQVTADKGSPTGTGWYYEGESVTITVEKIIGGEEGVRYVFVGWSDGIKDVQRTITMNKPVEIHANYKTQYYFTVISDYGRGHGSGWYDEGSYAIASVDEKEIDIGFPYIMVFKRWTGDASGEDLKSNPVIMDAPKKAIALWERKVAITLYALVGTIIAVAVLSVFFIKFKGRLLKTWQKKQEKSSNLPYCNFPFRWYRDVTHFLTIHFYSP
ncbi:MAG: hypothetical protein QXO15_09195 [Nitrososphaerota archaeon]